MIFSKVKNKKLHRAKNYDEWKALALEEDKKTGMDVWRAKQYCKLYDYAEIRTRLNTIRNLREKGDDKALLFTLNEGIHGNMGGMGKAQLYNKALFGTKNLIVDYIDEVAGALEHIADFNNTSIALKDKLDFFHRASICFGRSALMLSGGGQVGNFHIGVLKAMASQNLLPSVISGSSAGSVFAALAGSKTDLELVKFLNEERVLEIAREEALLYEGMADGASQFKEKDLDTILERLLPNITFQEAFEKTGRKINISVAPHGLHQKSRLLNAITSPNVLLRSAVKASCAVPGIFSPVTLRAKNRAGEIQPYLPSRRWVDGSMSNDLPSKRLTRLYGVNHFIVSLTNPIVLPFIKDPAELNEFFMPYRKLGTNIIKEWAQFNYSIAKRFFKYLPTSVAFGVNAFNSVIQQTYTGDINIISDYKLFSGGKVLSNWTAEELRAIIDEGERETWSKLETIRITTKIGRVLDKILADYETAVLNRDTEISMN